MKLIEFLTEWIKNPGTVSPASFDMPLAFDFGLILNKTDELLAKLLECEEFKHVNSLQFIELPFVETKLGDSLNVTPIKYTYNQLATHAFKLNNYIYSIQLIPVFKTTEDFLKEDKFGAFVSSTKVSEKDFIPYKEVCFKIPLEPQLNKQTSITLPNEEELNNLLFNSENSHYNDIIAYDVILRGIFYSPYNVDDMIVVPKENIEFYSYNRMENNNNVNGETTEVIVCYNTAIIPDEYLNDFKNEYGDKKGGLTLNDVNEFFANHNLPLITPPN